MANVVQVPPGPKTAGYLFHGISGCLYLSQSKTGVVKVPLFIEERPAIELEQKIYDCLTRNGHHPGLLR